MQCLVTQPWAKKVWVYGDPIIFLTFYTRSSRESKTTVLNNQSSIDLSLCFPLESDTLSGGPAAKFFSLLRTILSLYFRIFRVSYIHPSALPKPTIHFFFPLFPNTLPLYPTLHRLMAVPPVSLGVESRFLIVSRGKQRSSTTHRLEVIWGNSWLTPSLAIKSTHAQILTGVVHARDN